MSKKNRWMRCEARKGMFDNEYAVTVTATSGSVMLFVETVDLHQTSSNSWLLPVQVLDEDEQYGLVQLPREPFEGPRVVKVEKRLLEEKVA